MRNARVRSTLHAFCRELQVFSRANVGFTARVYLVGYDERYELGVSAK